MSTVITGKTPPLLFTISWTRLIMTTQEAAASNDGGRHRHYYRNLYGGWHFGFLQVSKATASIQRPLLMRLG
jgi:hypothetical protein